MQFRHHLRIALSASIIFVASVLAGCMSPSTREQEITRINPLVQTELAEEVKTPTLPAAETPTATRISLSTPTSTPTNTTTGLPIATETQLPTLRPTSTFIPFNFQGTVVLSIAPDIEVNELALWQWSTDHHELQPLLTEEGVIFGQPLLSPTGRYIAYTHVMSDSTSIWVLDMTTGNTRKWSEDFQTISMELQGYPHLLNGIVIQSWIPDETALVFQYWEEQVALDEPIWSYILFEDGRSTQLGSRIQDISWSIDEPNKLVYFSEFEGIYLVDINQIEMSNQLLQGIDATNGSLSWHPDGQYIAIAGNRRNNVPLWMLDLSTKQLTEMRSGEFGDQLVRWSPNGKSLLWVTNNQVKILGFRENNFTELESFQFSTYLIKSPEYPWLSDSNYFGLIFTSASSPDRDLCFYSIFGEKVGCPFQTNDIRNQADLDETNLELAITWSP